MAVLTCGWSGYCRDSCLLKFDLLFTGATLESAHALLVPVGKFMQNIITAVHGNTTFFTLETNFIAPRNIVYSCNNNLPFCDTTKLLNVIFTTFSNTNRTHYTIFAYFLSIHKI